MKIAVEIDIRKLLILAGMALSTWLSIKIGCADALVMIVPAGIYGLFSKENTEMQK